ncbi:MAG: F0F1 ATP synthase subunit delta [Campylobacterales bacterium]|nr:F0F1 ATP synthase subunit delta [Campylobacterales bacterium]
MEELIANRYTKALLGTKNANAAKYQEILSDLSDAICNNSELLTALKSPMIESKKKAEIIIDPMGKILDSNLTNLINILGEKNRLMLIPYIAKLLGAYLQKEANAYSGIVLSKKKIDKKELAELEDTIGKYTQSKVSLSYEKGENEGVKVVVDDLGVEVNFSKERVKEQLIEFISKAL